MGLRELLKFIPWVGIAANAAAAFAFMYASGWVWYWYFLQIQQGHIPSADELRDVYREQLQKGVELWRTHPSGASAVISRRSLVLWTLIISARAGLRRPGRLFAVGDRPSADRSGGWDRPAGCLAWARRQNLEGGPRHARAACRRHSRAIGRPATGRRPRSSARFSKKSTNSRRPSSPTAPSIRAQVQAMGVALGPPLSPGSERPVHVAHRSRSAGRRASGRRRHGTVALELGPGQPAALDPAVADACSRPRPGIAAFKMRPGPPRC